MIDFKEVYRVLRNVIITRTGLDPRVVIRLNQTGAKPKEMFAGLDIIDIQDSNSYLTDKIFDEVNDQYIYKTHKNIFIRMSVHNGNPENQDDQMDVSTVCNSVHKAFTEELVLGYIYDQLEATVLSTGAITPTYDSLPTGYGAASFFTVVLCMIDETVEDNTPIEIIETPIMDSDGDGVEDIDDRFPYDPNESVDTDGDGIGDNADTDDDGDGFSDEEEIAAGTDPLDPNDFPAPSQVNMQQQPGMETFTNSLYSGTTPTPIEVTATSFSTSDPVDIPDNDGLSNIYATKFTGITSPVYLEFRLWGSQGEDSWGNLEPFVAFGCDNEKFLKWVTGDSSAINFGGYVVGYNVDRIDLYTSNLGPENFLAIDQFSDRNLASAGWFRVGIMYDPTTESVDFLMFSENLVDLRYSNSDTSSDSTTSEVSTVAKRFNSEMTPVSVDASPESLDVCIMGIRYCIPGTTQEFELLTKSSDFLIPGGIPAGYTALDEVTGSTTAEYDLGDYIP